MAVPPCRPERGGGLRHPHRRRAQQRGAGGRDSRLGARACCPPPPPPTLRRPTGATPPTMPIGGHPLPRHLPCRTHHSPLPFGRLPRLCTLHSPHASPPLPTPPWTRPAPPHPVQIIQFGRGGCAPSWVSPLPPTSRWSSCAVNGVLVLNAREGGPGLQGRACAAAAATSTGAVSVCVCSGWGCACASGAYRRGSSDCAPPFLSSPRGLPIFSPVPDRSLILGDIILSINGTPHQLSLRPLPYTGQVRRGRQGCAGGGCLEVHWIRTPWLGVAAPCCGLGTRASRLRAVAHAAHTHLSHAPAAGCGGVAGRHHRAPDHHAGSQRLNEPVGGPVGATQTLLWLHLPAPFIALPLMQPLAVCGLCSLLLLCIPAERVAGPRPSYVAPPMPPVLPIPLDGLQPCGPASAGQG